MRSHGRGGVSSSADNTDGNNSGRRNDDDIDKDGGVGAGNSDSYYDSEDHMEALDSVSKEAVRMREIKDDLTAVLQRLQEGERRSPTAAELPQLRSRGSGGEVGGRKDEAPTVSREAYGDGGAVPLEEEKLDRSSTLQAERTVRFFSVFGLPEDGITKEYQMC